MITVENLRDPVLGHRWWDQYLLEAADRIEALEAELLVRKSMFDDACAKLEALRSAPPLNRYTEQDADANCQQLLNSDEPTVTFWTRQLNLAFEQGRQIGRGEQQPESAT